MLNKIVLKDFQCHEKLRIDIDQPITVLTGSSDSGKSAVVRALKWACQGGSGTGFKRHGGDQPKVSLWIDAAKVTRSPAGMQMNESTYAAVGQKVPDEIAEFLKLGPENFQSQLDPPFWFTDSAGEVSKSLNRMVNLDQIDKALTASLTAKTNAAKTVEVLTKLAADGKQAAKQLDWVPDMVAAHAALYDLELKRDHTTDQIKDLTDMLDHADRLKNVWVGKEKAANFGAAVVDDVEDLMEIGAEILSLEVAIDQINYTKKKITKVPHIAPLEKAFQADVAAEEEFLCLEAWLSEIHEVETKLWRLKKMHAPEKKKLDEEKNCPLCGSHLLSP